jgi:hypothetical protein
VESPLDLLGRYLITGFFVVAGIANARTHPRPHRPHARVRHADARCLLLLYGNASAG